MFQAQIGNRWRSMSDMRGHIFSQVVVCRTRGEAQQFRNIHLAHVESPFTSAMSVWKESRASSPSMRSTIAMVISILLIYTSRWAKSHHQHALRGRFILPLIPIPKSTALNVVALRILSIWSLFMLRLYGCFVTRSMAAPVTKTYAPASIWYLYA